MPSAAAHPRQTRQLYGRLKQVRAAVATTTVAAMLGRRSQSEFALRLWRRRTRDFDPKEPAGFRKVLAVRNCLWPTVELMAPRKGLARVETLPCRQSKPVRKNHSLDWVETERIQDPFFCAAACPEILLVAQGSFVWLDSVTPSVNTVRFRKKRTEGGEM